MLLIGEKSKHDDILQGVAQGCTLSPCPFEVYSENIIEAVEAAKQGVTVGGVRVGDRSLRMTLRGHQKHPKNYRNK